VDKKTTYIVIAVMLLAVASWYLFSSRLPDNGSRVNEIGADISAVGVEQQSAIDRLGTIENGLSDSAAEAGRVSEGLGDTTGTIAGVEDRISASQDRVRDSAEIIREGQSIISGVRARGQVRD